MSEYKPFRFSLQSFNTDSPANWRNLIAKTEDLGYSTFFLADHFLSAGPALDSTYHPPTNAGCSACDSNGTGTNEHTARRLPCFLQRLSPPNHPGQRSRHYGLPV